MQYDLEKRINQILTLKKKIEEIKERQAAELEPYVTGFERLRADVRIHLVNSKQDSSKTSAGTATLVMNTYYKVEDQSAFRNYVIDNQSWGLVYWGKTIAEGVKVFQKEQRTTAGPPGIKVTSELTVRISSPPKPKTEGEKTTVKVTEAEPEVETL